jgi:ABC-2 type transport system ATP-binding protein
MADNIVVIGKGKLVVDTSIAELMSGNKKSQISVHINKSDYKKLESLLDKAKLKFVQSGGAFLVSGITQEKLGKLIFEGGIQVNELSSKGPSLEEVFIDITGDKNEFVAKPDPGENK